VFSALLFYSYLLSPFKERRRRERRRKKDGKKTEKRRKKDGKKTEKRRKKDGKKTEKRRKKDLSLHGIIYLDISVRLNFQHQRGGKAILSAVNLYYSLNRKKKVLGANAIYFS